MRPLSSKGYSYGWSWDVFGCLHVFSTQSMQCWCWQWKLWPALPDTAPGCWERKAQRPHNPRGGGKAGQGLHQEVLGSKKRSQYEPMSPICTSKKGACMFTTTVSLLPCSKESFTSPVFSAMRPSHLLEMVKFNFFFLGLSWRCFTTLWLPVIFPSMHYVALHWNRITGWPQNLERCTWDKI